MDYNSLILNIKVLIEKYNNLYKQVSIMFIPRFNKTFKENGYEEHEVVFDEEIIIEDFLYKERKTIYFIKKYLDKFIKILDINEIEKQKDVFIPIWTEELTYYFDSIVSSIYVLLESEQRILLEKYFDVKEIYPRRNKFGLFTQVYMLRNRIMHFTENRYIKKNNEIYFYETFSSKNTGIRINKDGIITMPCMLIDIYKDDEIKIRIFESLKKYKNPFNELFPNKYNKEEIIDKPRILHIEKDIYFDYVTSGTRLLNDIELFFDTINNIFLNYYKKYYDNVLDLYNSKTKILIDDEEIEYAVKDIFNI